MDQNENENENSETYPPLERRFIEIEVVETGARKRAPALSKKYVPDFKYIRFYLPSLEAMGDYDPWLGPGTPGNSAIEDWKEYMELMRDDLRWLLHLKHHKFWSVMIYSTEVSDEILPSFLLRAPRFFDRGFEDYLSHPVVGPLYRDIYSLVFRIYLRLSTFKESKEDYITREVWAEYMNDNYLFDFAKILDLCALYGNKENLLFQKMIDNVIKHGIKLRSALESLLPVLMSKSIDLGKDLGSRIKENEFTNEWKQLGFEEALAFMLDNIVSIYKLLKVYPPASVYFHSFPGFESQFADLYDENVKMWGKVVEKLPCLETHVNALRIYMIRLFRIVVATPTILCDKTEEIKIDEFFNSLTSCLDNYMLIHDYERAYPFKCDMQNLISRGCDIEQTRIEYVANAIEACFEACGERYSVSMTVTDPLYDPNFDRQLLGACSLDVVGVELESLICQVKDLLPDLPKRYIEVCLKHYGYNAETVINALLEGSVPADLDRFKNPNLVNSGTEDFCSKVDDEPLSDRLLVPLVDDSLRPDGNLNLRYSKKTEKIEKPFEFGGVSQELKARILKNLEIDETESMKKKSGSQQKVKDFVESSVEETVNNYIDESLLPQFNENIEYDDEYDDTYDQVGVGMTEPDNPLYNPLNQKLKDMTLNANNGSDGESNDVESGPPEQNKNFEHFVEDPAVVRERMERRWTDQAQKKKRNPQQERSTDVVGKAKGHGQDKDVVLNRRQKDQSGSHNRKARSDWKRKEF